jgi:hypothetical protein
MTHNEGTPRLLVKCGSAGRAEATWAGLLGQVSADEGQRLLGHIVR